MFYQLYMQTILCGKMIQQLKKEKEKRSKISI